MPPSSMYEQVNTSTPSTLYQLKTSSTARAYSSTRTGIHLMLKKCSRLRDPSASTSNPAQLQRGSHTSTLAACVWKEMRCRFPFLRREIWSRPWPWPVGLSDPGCDGASAASKGPTKSLAKAMSHWCSPTHKMSGLPIFWPSGARQQDALPQGAGTS
ncbi:hypothetical protein COCVIDRAFT_15856 [Bipolaris victoriae FI3]|uniref:Uncharacterized protein n=1 Tax=Bipolaris victoriae (strain FI3) TaxID=930091 RepID=W7EFW2_BIPV3|nr:hypothetical protein COCVIDRAFT_15856 [Bipolaris victoriae FI3]